MRYSVANFITFIRIFCSIALLFCPVLSIPFYVLYIMAGVSDMIDGTVARKTNTVSEFGSRLDTIADLIFVVVCMIKLIPIFDIQIWEWIWISLIAVIKLINVGIGFVTQRKFVAIHSVMNKITGMLLFVLPLTISFIRLQYSIIVVSSLATFAAIQELWLIVIKSHDKKEKRVV